MRIKHLIDCHLSYLFTRSSKLIICLITILMGIVYISGAISSDYNSVSDNVNSYYISSITISKIIFTTLACFMINNFFNYRNDAYICLIIIAGIKKSKYFITKLFSILFTLLIIAIVLCLLYLLFGFIFIKGFVYEKRFIESFIWIYIIVIIYGIYSLIISLIINNNFGFLVPTFASILMQTIAQGNVSDYLKGLFIIFPALNNNLNRGYYSIYIYLIMGLFLIIFSIYIYLKIDKRSE